MWLFPLGTDDLGRDILSRLIYASRISMSLAFLTVLAGVLIGASLGLISGYIGGTLDKIIMSLVDIMMSFPSIILAILITAVLGPGLFNTGIAVTIMSLPAFIRIMRAEALKEKNKDYALAVKSFGAGPVMIVFKHILPNSTSPLIVQAVLSFSESILNIAALGFLGLGAEPPSPEWGTMINDGRNFMNSAWWLVVWPGLCILFLVLSLNIAGGALREILNPKD